MPQKATIRVRLDTSEAKTELRDLGREGSRVAGQIRDGMSTGSEAGGGAARGFGVGAALGAGFGLARRAGSWLGAPGDIISEGASGYVRSLERWSFGEAGVNARAMSNTRMNVRETMASYVGRTGDLGSAVAMYNQLLPYAKQKELGRFKIDERLGSGRGTDPEGKGQVERAIEKVVKAISDGFDRLAEKLRGSK